jgi:hypothetical protein
MQMHNFTTVIHRVPELAEHNISYDLTTHLFLCMVHVAAEVLPGSAWRPTCSIMKWNIAHSLHIWSI